MANDTTSAYDRQVECSEHLVLDARRLRMKHGCFIAVFEDRHAVLAGANAAVREMDGRVGHDRNLVAIIDEFDVVAPASNLLRPDISESARATGEDSPSELLDTMERYLGRLQAASEASVTKEILARFGIDFEISEVDGRATQLPLLLRGDATDAGPWRFDLGILDEDLGCSEPDSREEHRLAIESGVFDFDICRSCPRLHDKSCRYVKGAWLAGGVVMAHATGLGRLVTVLLGSPPPSEHVALASLWRGYLRSAKALGNDALNAVKRIMRGEVLPPRNLASLSSRARRARRTAALAERLARQNHRALAEGGAGFDELHQADLHILGAIRRRRLRCGLVTILDAAAWFACQGKPLPTANEIHRPLLVPPVTGIFVAFPDNVDKWAAELVPLGVRAVPWEQVEEWISDFAPSIKHQLGVGAVFEAATEVAVAGTKIEQKAVAERLGIPVDTLKNLFRGKRGSKQSWRRLKRLAERWASRRSRASQSASESVTSGR